MNSRITLIAFAPGVLAVSAHDFIGNTSFEDGNTGFSNDFGFDDLRSGR